MPCSRRTACRTQPSATAVVDGLRSNPLVSDQEEVHEVYRRWRTLAEKYQPHRLLVGEVNLEPARAARYTRADEMHQAFAFAFVKLGWDPAAWAAVGPELEAARQLHGAAPSWALENHDIVRSVTRFGGGEAVAAAARARAALLALLGLPGAAYIYQGQELGLPEVDVPVEARVDPMWARGGITRDGARVPLPWTEDAALNHGFSLAVPRAGGVSAAAPWLPQPEGWGSHAIETQQQDPGSTLALVTAAVGLRRKLWEQGVFTADDGGSWRVEDGNLLICERSRAVPGGRRDGNRAGAAAGRDGAGQRGPAGNRRLAAAGQRGVGAPGLRFPGRVLRGLSLAGRPSRRRAACFPLRRGPRRGS